MARDYRTVGANKIRRTIGERERVANEWTYGHVNFKKKEIKYERKGIEREDMDQFAMKRRGRKRKI